MKPEQFIREQGLIRRERLLKASQVNIWSATTQHCVTAPKQKSIQIVLIRELSL